MSPSLLSSSNEWSKSPIGQVPCHSVLNQMTMPRTISLLYWVEGWVVLTFIAINLQLPEQFRPAQVTLRCIQSRDHLRLAYASVAVNSTSSTLPLPEFLFICLMSTLPLYGIGIQIVNDRFSCIRKLRSPIKANLRRFSLSLDSLAHNKMNMDQVMFLW